MSSRGEQDNFAKWCQPFIGAGYRLFPVARLSKVPRDKGWQSNSYTSAELASWIGNGGNIGVRLGADDLVIDVDPRHDGLNSLRRLESALDIDVGDFPAVLSGRSDGGRHIYFKKPTTLRVSRGVSGYVGIDVKVGGGFVLAPGSRHPATGKHYRLDHQSPAIGEVRMAPETLLNLLRRHEPIPRASLGGGELTVAQLKHLLAALDPAVYGAGQYDRWFRLAAAAHDATDGEGLEEWLAWAARDPDYGSESDDERNRLTWAALRAGKAGGVTYRWLLSEVARAGRLDLVLEVEPTFTSQHDQFARAMAPIIDTAAQRRSAPIARSIPTHEKG